MTKKTKKRNIFSFQKKSKKTKSKINQGFYNTVLNGIIGILSILLIAFIFSFSKRNTQDGVPMNTLFPEPKNQPKLAVEIYNKNPVLDIEIEILNGCGRPGLAGEFSDFLRSKNVDVIRAENANHFKYNKTQLIQRNENFEGLKHVAKALGFDLKDNSRVIIEPDAGSDVDLTLIIGKDYTSIKPLIEFTDNTP